MVRAASWLLLVLAAIALAGCGGSKQTLTLRGEGSAGTIEVRYRVGDEDTVTESVQSPWRLDIEVGGDWSVDLVVENTTTSGLVTCALEGEAIRRPVGTNGEASAHCSARKSGSSTSYETEGEEFTSTGTDTTSTDTSAAPSPIEKLPIDISGARRITATANALYLPIGAKIVQYLIGSKESQVVALRGDDAATPPDIDAVAYPATGSLFAVDVGTGAVYSTSSGFGPFAHVVGAADIVAVGKEVWVPAVGDGASNKPGIVRFDGVTGKKLGVIPDYTDLLAVGPGSVVAYRGSDFALLGLDGSVRGRGTPTFPSALITGAYLDDGKVLVGSREESKLYLLDPSTWEATEVSDEYDTVHSDGTGGAVVEHLAEDRIAEFDVSSGMPKSGVSPIMDAAIAVVTPNAIWMRSDPDLHRVDRSVLG